MTVGYTIPNDWDGDTGVHEVSSVVPLSVRNKAQQIIVARDERGSAQRAIAKHMTAQTEAHIAKRASDKRYLAVVDAFLADKESAFAKLVPARPVNGETRRRRAK
jgi:hypothetical protein